MPCTGCNLSSEAIAKTLVDAANFGKAVINHVANGLPQASDQLKDARLSICKRCQFKQGDYCQACSCYMPLKASWLDSDCPKGLWLVNSGVQKVMDIDSCD
jgi:hypothetical protein